MISKKQFLSDVLHEATVLRNMMTDAEKDRLDLSTLNPNKWERCIYGQSTGSCQSQRAKDLMDAACIRVVDVSDQDKNPCDLIYEEKNTWENIKPMINGDYLGKTWTEQTFAGKRNYNYLSMIEAYICLDTANNKGLIDYIKGDINTVKL